MVTWQIDFAYVFKVPNQLSLPKKEIILGESELNQMSFKKGVLKGSLKVQRK